MATTTGGALIARMLKNEGVEKFFGIIDNTYWQLFLNCCEQGMQMITPRHESVAAHMAGAYARLTGKIGVCIASNGPGVANMLSGAAVENAEGNRVLLITSSRRGGIARPDRGGAYQCIDQTGIIRAMSKWSQTAETAERIPELFMQALRACWEGRPGLVHFDVPENVINQPCEEPRLPLPLPHQYRRTEPIHPSPAQVAAAADLLAAAKRPVLHAGGGVISAQAYDELRQVAELLHAPVSTSWNGRSALPEDHELAIPMIHAEANVKMRGEADVILVLGSMLGETDFWAKAPYWGKRAEQKYINVNISDQWLSRNHPSEINVLADAKVFLGLLAEELKARRMAEMETRKAFVAALRESVDGERAFGVAVLAEDRAAPMLTGHISAVCGEVFGKDAVAVFDGGNAAVWSSAFYQALTPNSFLTTHHMGHLGAGIGQALGAAVARPDKPVYCIIGDGAMGFHMQEIETAIRNNLKVVFLVAVDKQWGMVKLGQMMNMGPVKDQYPNALPGDRNYINGDFSPIEWDKLAQSMGAYGERLSAPDDLAPALRRCIESGKCSVLHVDVDPEKHMMAPGLQTFKEMHQEPAGE